MKYAIAAAAIVAGVAAAPANEWETYTTTSSTTTPYASTWGTYTTPSATTWATYTTPSTTKPAEWTTWAPTTTKCSSVSTYTTSECGANKDAWDNCKTVTKTTTVYPETCTGTWASWTTASASWSPVPYKCSTVSVWTTKECSGNGWDNCKDYTKTSTYYPTVCPTTWSEVYVTSVKPTETWAPVVYSSKVPVAASSSVYAPVAKFTGAANKETFGMGALAIAAVAAML